MSTEKRTSRPPRGQLRQALIDTSLELISEEGVRALTLREIGSRLQVSRMALYRHFADKGALLGAIAGSGFAKFADTLENALAAAGPEYEAQFEALALAYVQFANENRAHFEVMFGGRGKPYFLDEAGERVANRSFQILRDHVCRGQELGLVVPGDATHLARMVWATVHGIATLNFEDEATITKLCSELLLTGLKPREGG